MPNTLAHLGIQALVTRAVIQQAEIKWIWAACVIPDLPWILQRVVRASIPGISPYDLRLYAIAQASLLMCLVFSAALALCSVRPGRVFVILGLGCVLHLLLDAAQTKWANGIHLFAPLSWELLNFGLFWPEDWLTTALTGIGLGYALYAWLRLPGEDEDLRRPRGLRLAAAAALCLAYAVLPLALMKGAQTADNHYVATLENVEARPGQPIGFDRNRITLGADGAWIVAWTSERFAAIGTLPDHSIQASVIGRFEDSGTVRITAYHRHPDGLRDLAAYLGLALVLAWWRHCLLRRCPM